MQMTATLDFCLQDVSTCQIVVHCSESFKQSAFLHDKLSLLGISPPGDLHIEKGQPWEMFCVLNTSHPDGQGGSYKNLSFYIDNKLAGEPTVKKYNETAIRLYVPVSQVSSNGPPHDFYGVTCKQNHVTGICVRHVYVGCEFSLFALHAKVHTFNQS
jgi:hypothetical protein